MSIVIGYNMSRPLPQSSSDGSKFGGSAAQTSLTSTYTGPAGPAGADGGVGPQGPAGSNGADGADGLGVPSGGTTDQLLKKVDGTDNNTTWFTPAWAASSHSHTASEVSDFDAEVANNSAVTANTAKVSNVTTDLSASADGTSLTVASSDGTDASIPAATTSAWGAMTDEDKTKLDGIETGADVTDTANVTAAGALMDSELTDLAGVKGVTISTLQPKPSEGAFADGDKTKLDGIASGAEVNVQSDWDASSGDAQILNKPTIPSNLSDLSDVDTTSPSTGQVLKWDGSSWGPDTDSTGGGGGGTTNLSASADGTSLTVASSSGDDASIPAATTSAWGAMTDEDKTKLDGIDTAATANDTDANLKARANHTGTQAASTITSFATEVANTSAVTANTAKVSNVTTNLSASADGTSLTVASSDGTDASIPAATTTAWGAMTDEDKTKLDGIEAGADVTDTANVTAAGALMDSELTDLAGVKGVTISTLQEKPSEGAFADGDKTKLDGIEAGADVTDTANVTAAGALMDSEVDADIKTLSLPASTTISDFGKTLVDDADAAAARTTLGVDASGTDNSTNVTLAGTPDYLTISGQEITRNQIDLANDVTGSLPDSSISSAATWNAKAAGDHDHDDDYVFTSLAEGGDGTAARIPSGANGDRPTSSVAGMFRWSTTDTRFEGYDGSDWGEIGGGGTTSNGLYEHAHTISANYTIGTNNNAISAGPVSVNSGVSVTVPSGSTWVVA